jgi:adenosylhomocysteine nucleosidase
VPTDDRTSLACDLLIFVATQTEEEQLQAVAGELTIPFERKNVAGVGEFYALGRVGDFLVNAVRTKMGPLSHGGSASRGILYQQATGATGIVQVGMAFGVDRRLQSIGDVLVSTALLPYDDRDARTEGSGTDFNYDRVKRHPAKPSLVAAA